ncbi:MAG: TolC family protein [bacterium]
MIKLLFVLALISGSVHASELTLEMLTDKISKDNFLVQEQAERVYQSKQSIKHARASLLPKLNVWTLLKIPAAFVDPFALGDIVQDLAPFLIPANWFQVKQVGAMARAQKEQYLALWGNELASARLLFYGVHRELSLRTLVIKSLADYQRILTIARARRNFGNGGGFALNMIQERILALEDDLRSMDLLVERNKRDLQYISGIDQVELIDIVQPTLPFPTDAPALDLEKLRAKAIASAPELKQYQHLELALKAIRGSMRFSVLGASTYSIGSGDGAFDQVPLTDGLGFGQGAAIKISKSELEILHIKAKATKQTILRQFELLASEYVLLEESYSNASQRFDLASLNQRILENQLRFGGEISPLELIEAFDNVARTSALKLSYQVRFAEVVEKLKRITFTAPYNVLGGLHE